MEERVSALNDGRELTDEFEIECRNLESPAKPTASVKAREKVKTAKAAISGAAKVLTVRVKMESIFE